MSAVLDWEMACTDPFAYDLGVALSAWCYGDGYDPARAAALVAGYRARRRVEPETLEALYPWACFAALRFAVSRIHGYHRAGLGADRLVTQGLAPLPRPARRAAGDGRGGVPRAVGI